MKKLILLPLLLIPILLFAGNDDAEPIVIGERFTLDSKIMAEPRPIWVSQPLGYDQSSERYPLMILLDGDGHFHHTTDRLLQQEKFDEAIAVFKENVKRYPESANVYDSLGDGYDAKGEFELARESYEKAYKRGLEIDDPNVQLYKAQL